MSRLVIALAVAIVAAIPATVRAEGNNPRGGFALRVDGDFVLPAGDEVETAVVVSGDATIAGTARLLIVIDGDASVSGRVTENVVVVDGSLRVEASGVVHDVRLVSSTMQEAPGSRIEGDVDRSARWAAWSAGALFFAGILFWAAITLTALVAGIVFAAVGGQQLTRATRMMSEQTGQSILAGVIAAIALPVTAIAAFVTLIAIPIGIGILLFVVPALMFLGYIVAATWIGSLVLSRRSESAKNHHPYAQAALGIAIVQLVVLIPGVAPFVFLVGGIWGSGALVYMAWRSVRPGSERELPAATATTPQTAPGS